MNQLVRENDYVNGYTYLYKYDLLGNLLNKYKIALSPSSTESLLQSTTAENALDATTYGYSDSSWGDLLTDYNGTAISYDEIGNPTNWRNTANMEWEQRKLTYHTNLDGTTRTTYLYNSEGIRTYKRVVELGSAGEDTVYNFYDYTLDGTKILSQHYRNSSTKENSYLYFIYDENGNVTGFNDGTNTYFYQKNIQGDIIRILDVDGNVVVEYTYDAWGKVLSITGSLADTIGQKNPFRYRSYYYDSETGWYYLNSRYYDPEVGRFLNADGILGDASTLVGHNMFLYCSNNPVMRVDNGGQFWETVFDVVSLAVSVVDVVNNPDDPMAWIGLAGDAIDLIPFVCGVGEVVRAVNTVDNIYDAYKTTDTFIDTVDTVNDAKKFADNTGDIIDTAGDAARKTDFYITPNGEVIPATLDGFNDNLSKLDYQNGKYVGVDSDGPIRIRTNEIHPSDPNFTGVPNPLHTVPHFHIDRRANGLAGKWGKTFTGPMEMLY